MQPLTEAYQLLTTPAKPEHPTVTPEPGTFLLLGLGLFMAVVLQISRRAK